MPVAGYGDGQNGFAARRLLACLPNAGMARNHCRVGGGFAEPTIFASTSSRLVGSAKPPPTLQKFARSAQKTRGKTLKEDPQYDKIAVDIRVERQDPFGDVEHRDQVLEQAPDVCVMDANARWRLA
jgi:hypothetical protein